MIARDLTLCKHVSAIPERELAQGPGRDWPHIADKVAEILERHPATESKVTSISLFRLGSSEDLGNNPLTVYISVSYESERPSGPQSSQHLLGLVQHDTVDQRFIAVPVDEKVLVGATFFFPLPFLPLSLFLCNVGLAINNRVQRIPKSKSSPTNSPSLCCD
jgi:hypothetical protein